MKKILGFLLMWFLALNSYAGEYSLIRSMTKPVVVISKKTGDIISTGSAVVIANGQILSAAHVIPETKEPFIIYLRDGQDKVMQITRIDRRRDLVLLSTDVSCPCAEVFAGVLDIDTTIYSVGFPLYTLYHSQYVSIGIIQGFERKVIVTNLESTFGSSGGPVYVKDNGQFKLIGLTQSVGKRDKQIYTWMTFTINTALIIEFLSNAPLAIEVDGNTPEQ